MKTNTPTHVIRNNGKRRIRREWAGESARVCVTRKVIGTSRRK